MVVPFFLAVSLRGLKREGKVPNMYLALRGFSELAGQDARCGRDGGTGGNTVRFIRPYRAGCCRHFLRATIPARLSPGHVDAQFGPAQCGGALIVRGGTMPA